MKKILQKILHKFFFWVFKEQIDELYHYTEANKKNYARIKNMLDNIDVSVDHNIMSNSWAVISIQGQNKDFIKFVDLGKEDIRYIQQFLQNFDRKKVDTAPCWLPELRSKKFF